MPQPIDMQSEAARAYTAQRAMQLAQQALEAAQARVAMQSRQEAQAAASQVAQSAQTEQEGVNSEGRGNGRQEDGKRKRSATTRRTPDASQTGLQNGDGGPHLDISI